MTAPVPFAPGAVREFLLAQAQYTALNVQSTTTRDLPEEITGPCVLIRAVRTDGTDPFLRRSRIQVDVVVPKLEILGGTVDPDELAWDIAATAGQLLGRAANISFRDAAWAGKWVEGPLSGGTDISRGADNPLYRVLVRVELKMRAPRS